MNLLRRMSNLLSLRLLLPSMTFLYREGRRVISPTKAFSYQQINGGTKTPSVNQITIETQIVERRVCRREAGTLIGNITTSVRVFYAPSRLATSSHLTFGVSLNIAPLKAPLNF